jgi:hypothetical protein
VTDGVPGFVLWRIDVDYLDDLQIAPIKPLLADLNFIVDKKHCGATFRFGQLRIEKPDFERIAQEMGCQI